MQELTVSVLGPLAVHRGGAPVDVGGPRQQALLAVLLAARGRLVPVDRLLDELWEERSESRKDSGRKTVSVAVSRLRAALGDPADAPRLRFLAGGYSLDLPADAVDAGAFRLGVTRARAQRAAGDLAGAAEQYAEALARWRGPAYAGLPGPTIDVERRGLEELRWSALEERAELRLDLGEDRELVDELVELAGRDALRERPVRLLATALSRSGRQVEALDAVRAAGRALRDDFGLDPGPELVALERELLSGGPAVLPKPRRAEPATPPAGPAGQGPPMPLTSFVGRAHLLDVVGGALQSDRLVTLTGAGGTGKTRLALEHLRDLPPSTHSWAPLVALRDAALVPDALAEALGAVLEPGRPPLAGAAAALGEREHLLVVDNAEHLLAAVARAVGELLSACGSLRVLVTSREPLGIPGERVLEVPPLAVQVGDAGDGPAVELFLARAAQGAGWSPDEQDLPAVRRICADLDGLPLALELAAARCRALDLAAIATALEDRFGLLASPGPVTVPHHRTLEAAVQWSYDLLSAVERAHLRALATFDGGFDLPAAQALTQDGPQATADLAARSLVTVDRTVRPWRYGLLETVRSFALARTDEQEHARLRARHLLWVAQLVADAAPHLRGPESAVWLPRLERERVNIRQAVRTALATGEPETALRLCADLAWAWYRAGHAQEGVALLDAALAAAPAEAPSRGRALIGLSALRYLLGDPAGALASAVEGTEHAVAAGDPVVLAQAQAYAGWMSALVGDLPGAQVWAQSSREGARRHGQPVIEAEALMVLGQLARFGPQPADAERLLLESMEVGRACGHRWVVDSSLWVAAKVALAAGDPLLALRRAGELTVSLGGAGDVPALLAGALVLAGAAAARGAGTEAGELCGAVDAIGGRIGFSVARLDPLDTGWVRALVEQALSPAELAEAQAKGAEWSVEDLLATCSGVADRLGADPA